MALMKTISGIRGTIGGVADAGLTPEDILKYTVSFAQIMLSNSVNKKIVVGRDGRMSGTMVHHLVVGALMSIGAEVIDLGLSTTPTVEMAVKFENAAGGIILTASHNPKEWNALKLLNSDGEFISGAIGKEVLENASKQISYASIDNIGSITINNNYGDKHIQAILDHPLVNKTSITNKNFRVVLDAINSTGATFVPQLLKALGVNNITVLNGDITGNFAHNPEPLPENLKELCDSVITNNAHLGIAVDPDVDRLCFVNEDGTLFGEEYTLVAVADYILSKKSGNTVSNLSSTRALKDVTEKHGGNYYASAVGEVNVVTTMKEVKALIGGEGNGGIIVPELHYGRDALIGIALFLTHLAESNLTISALRNTYPNYYMSKNKIELAHQGQIDPVLDGIKLKYSGNNINTIDGVKIEFDHEWVHLRASNTEPIIRVYTESTSMVKADELAARFVAEAKALM
jgi:phosphomannomutase